LLLNVPPDRRGLIHENDAARLHEFGQWVQETFKENLAQRAEATATHTRSGPGDFGAHRTADGNLETFWSTAEWPTSADITYTLPAKRRFNVVSIQEEIRQGQRISDVALEAWIDGNWRELGHATTVGYRRLMRFAPVETDRVRLRILNSRICPTV